MVVVLRVMIVTINRATFYLPTEAQVRRSKFGQWTWDIRHLKAKGNFQDASGGGMRHEKFKNTYSVISMASLPRVWDGKNMMLMHQKT